MREECYQCHTKTINTLIEKFKLSNDLSKLFIKAGKKLLNDNKDLANPYLATNIHRLAKNIINHSVLYKEEKERANKLLLNNYSSWQAFVQKNNDPFYTAVKLAVAGNIIDYGAHTAPSNIELQINKLVEKNFAIDETQKLHKQIKLAKSILYLGDNAGEIVFDKLLIETMNHPNVTYVVRGRPVINDVTKEDSDQVGMDQQCRVISNGYDAPSTLLEYCSTDFIEEYKNADLIISKGQGNFEGLMDSNHSNLFFMLIAKCEPMAELLGVIKDDMLVTQLKVR